MKRREVKSFEITITPADLEVIALVCLKIVGPEKRIASIKKMREVTAGMKIVDEFGGPMMGKVGPCPNCER